MKKDHRTDGSVERDSDHPRHQEGEKPARGGYESLLESFANLEDGKRRTDRASLEPVTNIVKQAREAEVEGEVAVASLLALEALKLHPDQPEARAILDRTQALLRRRRATAPSPLFPPSDESVALGLPVTRVPGLAAPPDFRLPAGDTSESRTRRRPRSRFLKVMAPILLVAAFLALGVSARRLWERDQSSQVVVGANGPTPKAEVPAAAGTVVLNITPWAKVEAIVNLADGRAMEHEQVISPAVVSLPPGRYLFTVSHPDFGSLQFPVAVVSGGQTEAHYSLLSDREFESELSGQPR